MRDARGAAVLGVHVRHYASDGGIQLGANADGLAGGGTMFLLDAEVGWGIQTAPELVWSANAAIGRATVLSEGIGENGRDISDHAVAVTPFVRLRADVSPRAYFSVDAGVIVTGEMQFLRKTSFVVPMSRLSVGLTF